MANAGARSELAAGESVATNRVHAALRCARLAPPNSTGGGQCAEGANVGLPAAVELE